MKIDRLHPLFDRAVVKLDGRIVQTAIAADDEEGWIEIVDPAAMAPLDPNAELDWSTEMEEPYTELKTKRRFGKVEIIVV